jgi:ribulose-phosphate 3-epimerase
MDGVFVPNLTFGPMLVEAIDRLTPLELDAHLMIVNPEKYLVHFIRAGTDWISFHCEATPRTRECIKQIKRERRKAGLAINPPTPFTRVVRYIDQLDYLLIMAVHPGFYGQKFIASTLRKIEKVKNYLTRWRFPCLIEVDGGINAENARSVADAGADMIVAGAGIFRTPEYKKAIAVLKCSKV